MISECDHPIQARKNIKIIYTEIFGDIDKPYKENTAILIKKESCMICFEILNNKSDIKTIIEIDDTMVKALKNDITSNKQLLEILKEQFNDM